MSNDHDWKSHRKRDWHSRKHKQWPEGRRRLFMQLGSRFGFMAFLFFGSMLLFGLLINSWEATKDGPYGAIIPFLGCSVTISFPLVAFIIARRTFRRTVTPIADVMVAANAVAEGDLSVRISETDGGEFGHLVHSFNHMIGELARADEQRRNLTADVAHELRTPLHIIQGNLEGILDDVYEPSPEHIEATLEETRLLARLVDDLQTLSLAEAGQLHLVQEMVDVVELMSDIQTSFSGQAAAAEIELALSLAEPREQLKVVGDTGRLDQILGILLTNALRYTPAGGTISLSAIRDGNVVEMVVADSGEGIPPEQLPFIFDRFWRGDKARTHRQGAGAGLGLAIARQLVEAHSGTITVESALKNGTTFTIKLPHARL